MDPTPTPTPAPAGPAEIAVVRQIYDAMAARDFARLFDFLHPEVVVTQDPMLPWGGHHVGHDGFAEFGLTLGSAIDSAVTIDGIFAADDEVIQCGRTRGRVRANGIAFDIPEVHRWTIQAGRAVKAHFAIDTAAMLEALTADTADTADGTGR